MTIWEFSILEKEDQEIFIDKHGTFLATREEDGFIFDLYKMNSFYVEFFYFTNDHGKIVVRCFTSMDELKPYLDTIDLDGLL
ncbi:MAG: hypothetical protein WKF97_01010 [Chitinophagaceae bacterium]